MPTEVKPEEESVFFYILSNDRSHIPTKKEWKGALQLMHAVLESHLHKLAKDIINLILDVSDLTLRQFASRKLVSRKNMRSHSVTGP